MDKGTVFQTFILVAAAVALFIGGSYFGPGRLREDVREIARVQANIEAWQEAHMQLPPHGGAIPAVVEAEISDLDRRVMELERAR